MNGALGGDAAAGGRQRLLLCLPSLTYRAEAFVDAAAKLDVALTVASDCAGALEMRQPAGMLTLDFRDPAAAAARVREFAREHPLRAVFGVDDETAIVAAAVGEALDLPHAALSATEAARDKHQQRMLLREQGVAIPEFSAHDIRDRPADVARSAPYPCVLKPMALSASRGVMRADTPEEFSRAHARLAAILATASVERGGDEMHRYLVESFVAGEEVALEGLLIDGRLHVLAIFDKPDPLDGPFFEETIYITPTRLPAVSRDAIVECARRSADALGLTHGPIHAEIRLNGAGAWLIEMAARPIGGRCGAALRFGPRGKTSLEELLLAHALGRVSAPPKREPEARGVMMIPTPMAGVLADVRGLEAARRVRGIADVVITAHRGQQLVPLPEGSRYLGFIFARGETAEVVESAIREAFSRLEILVE